MSPLPSPRAAHAMAADGEMCNRVRSLDSSDLTFGLAAIRADAAGARR